MFLLSSPFPVSGKHPGERLVEFCYRHAEPQCENRDAREAEHNVFLEVIRTSGYGDEDGNGIGPSQVQHPKFATASLRKSLQFTR